MVLTDLWERWDLYQLPGFHTDWELQVYEGAQISSEDQCHQTVTKKKICYFNFSHYLSFSTYTKCDLSCNKTHLDIGIKLPNTMTSKCHTTSVLSLTPIHTKHIVLRYSSSKWLICCEKHVRRRERFAFLFIKVSNISHTII